MGETHVVSGRHVTTHESDRDVQTVNEDPTIVVVWKTLSSNAEWSFAKFRFDAKIAGFAQESHERIGVLGVVVRLFTDCVIGW